MPVRFRGLYEFLKFGLRSCPRRKKWFVTCQSKTYVKDLFLCPDTHIKASKGTSGTGCSHSKNPPECCDVGMDRLGMKAKDDDLLPSRTWAIYSANHDVPKRCDTIECAALMSVVALMRCLTCHPTAYQVVPCVGRTGVNELASTRSQVRHWRTVGLLAFSSRV